MIALKLVHLIEKHADDLAKRLLHTVAQHPRTQTFYKNIPHEELRDRALEIYKHLSAWLTEKSEEEIREKNFAVGERRAEQRVPLHEVIFAVNLVKATLLKEVKASGLGDSAIELFQALELADRVNQFFDKSIYFIALGYQSAVLAGKVPLPMGDSKEQKEFKELRHLVLPWWP